MPLRDHFHSPVIDKHRWGAVYGQWPGEIVRTLFDLLPQGFVAEPKIHHGSPFEVDVSMLIEVDRSPFVDEREGQGGTATLTATAPPLTVPADLSESDEYEILVYDTHRMYTLVAAIELVSPANKDRPETRQQFLGKVDSLLRQDVSVSIVDVVTIHHTSLYAELLARFGRTDPRFGQPAGVAVRSYPPWKKAEETASGARSVVLPTRRRSTSAYHPSAACTRNEHRPAARTQLPRNVPIVADRVKVRHLSRWRRGRFRGHG